MATLSSKRAFQKDADAFQDTVLAFQIGSSLLVVQDEVEDIAEDNVVDE